MLLLYHHIVYLDVNYAILTHISKSCVYIFVFLSSYGLTLSNISRSSPKRTIKWISNHIWKLECFFFPHFIICILLSLIFYRDDFFSTYSSVKTFIFDLLGITNILGGRPLVRAWWYMGLALSLTLIVPIIALLYKKFGPFSIIPALAIQIMTPNFNYKEYALVITLGAISAHLNILSKITGYINNSLTKKTVLFLILICITTIVPLGIVYLYIPLLPETLSFYLDSIVKTLIAIVFVIISICISMSERISRVLGFLGYLSDDMFLIHIEILAVFPMLNTAIGLYAVNFTILLIASILITLIYKASKNRTRYNEFTERIYSAIDYNIF